MSLYFMSFPVAAFLMFATVAATRPPRDVNGVEVSFFLSLVFGVEKKREREVKKSHFFCCPFRNQFQRQQQLPSPLTVPNVFYALALLRLPVLYLGIFFVTAVEKVAELAASLKRLDAFLALPEPPPPAHLRGKTAGDDERDVAEDVAVAFRGADFDWGGKCRGGGGKGAGAAAEEEELGGASSRFSFESTSGGEAATAPPSVPGPTLKSITLHVKKGELLGIAGPVGSGKSSLLLALLSELLPCPAASTAAADAAAAADDAVAAADDGEKKKPRRRTKSTGLSPVVRGSLAYCSQVPWIPPGTLRDAILFGSPYDEERYERSVDAAALRPDLEALPAGDLTEIGERGVNLSGGQRARVALARAAYADADVVLLDDPLSALDARVGAAVFERCIANGPTAAATATAGNENPETPPPSSSSMMSGKTRLLVTHARHYLPRCDRVAVVRNGEVVALGTPTELAEKGVPELVAAVREAEAASGGAGAGDVDAAADAAGAADDDDQEGAGAAVAAIVSTAANDVDAAGELSEWDESGSRPQTPAPPLSASAGSDDVSASLAADASAPSASVTARSARSAAASRLRRAISNNLRAEGRREAKAAERRGDGDGYDDGRGSGGGVGFGGVGVGSVFGSTLGRGLGSLRLAASRRFRGGGAMDPALATVGDAVATPLPLSASSSKKGGGGSGGGIGGGGKKGSSPDRDSERLALGALVKAEGRAEGGVGGRVYASWAARLGGPACALVAVGLLAGQGAYLFAEYWVSILSPAAATTAANPSSPANSRSENLRAEIAGRKVSQSTWLEVYGALTAAICLLGAARALVFFDASVKAASSLHASMVDSLVRAPLAFFHTTPAGRILNRLTKDQGIADDYLPSVAFDSLQSVFMSIGERGRERESFSPFFFLSFPNISKKKNSLCSPFFLPFPSLSLSPSHPSTYLIRRPGPPRRRRALRRPRPRAPRPLLRARAGALPLGLARRQAPGRYDEVSRLRDARRDSQGLADDQGVCWGGEEAGGGVQPGGREERGVVGGLCWVRQTFFLRF